MVYETFLDKSRIPGEQTILAALGSAKTLWLELCGYILTNFDVVAENWYFTKRRGWSVRYRRGKKTLCYMFPEQNTFSILIILGRAEVAKADRAKDRLNEMTRHIFETTEQYHDGRWIWLQAADESDVQSFKVLLAAKIKPKTAVCQ
ncbi:MAG: DUF3788 domain-containing protein [Bacillota bacterium]